MGHPRSQQDEISIQDIIATFWHYADEIAAIELFLDRHQLLTYAWKERLRDLEDTCCQMVAKLQQLETECFFEELEHQLNAEKGDEDGT